MSHLPNYNALTVSDIQQLYDEYTDELTKANNNTLALSDEEINWNTFFQVDLDLSCRYAHQLSLFEMKSFHTNEEIRDKCNEMITNLEQFQLNMSMNKELYNKFNIYYNTTYQTEKSSLTSEQNKYVEDTLLSYKKSGMHLEDNLFDRLKEVQSDIIKLTSNFQHNLDNENTSFTLTENQLSGLPELWLNNHKQLNGSFNVTLKYPDYVPVMEYCSNRDTRRSMWLAFNSRCKVENDIVLRQILLLKKELATLLGHANYSDHKLQDKMAKTTNTVNEFLHSLNDRLTPLLENDLTELSKFASTDGIMDLQSYDLAYYSRIHNETKLNFNKQDLKQYFSLHTVMNGLFSIYQQLLGLRFVDVTSSHHHKFWHEDVQLFEVYDADTHELMGYFCLDLFPREGKYSHAAEFPFVKKSAMNLPFAVVACNFSKNDNLTFDEVETFFHEFGHVMHEISAESTIPDMSGTSCEWDFVEAPSQIFEEWCYRPNSLKLMAPTIPNEIIEKLNQERQLLQGLHYKRQLSFGFLDMALHGSLYNTSPAELYNKIYFEMFGINLPNEINFPATFGHIIGGYDAGYYGYLWSQVYAKDMFTSKFYGNELNGLVGREFRKTILSKGGSVDSYDSVTSFLGRSPNDHAFISSLFGTLLA